MKPIIETIDKIPNDILIHVVRHSGEYTWNFFAMKIILTRLSLKIKMNEKNSEILPECCEELRNLLKKSAGVPNSQNDLKQILSLIEEKQ